MSSGPAVLQVGIDHRSAPLAILEQAQARAGSATTAPLLAMGVAGAVPVMTCHRVELYVEGSPLLEGRQLLDRWLGQTFGHETAVCRTGAEAARHLLRVAAGLESAVLGEDQILGQLRAAYRVACGRCLPGPMLHRLFHAAFRAGKRARSETSIQLGSRSLAGCAVAYLDHCLGGFHGRTVLVLGAGQMGCVAASRLVKRGASPVLIANRTFQRAAKLARSTGGLAIPWAWRTAALRGADAVLIATAAPEPVLTGADLRMAAKGRRRPLLAVDLAVPRNLRPMDDAPSTLIVADVVSLGRRLEDQRRRRKTAIRGAERIVEEELELWLTWAASRSTDHTCRREAIHVHNGV